MIKKLMSPAVMLGVSLFLTAGPLHPAWAFMGTYIDGSQVAVATTPATPTKLISACPTAAGDVGILPFWSGSGTKPNGEYLLLSSENVALSTLTNSGTLRIPAGNLESERIWLKDYVGALYGVVIGTSSSMNVSVIRKR